MYIDLHSFRSIISLCLLSIFFFNCKEKKVQQPAQGSETSEIEQTVENKVRIHPISHASMILQYEEIDIYVDPVGPDSLYTAFPDPDLILISDVHGDHFSLATLEALTTENAKIIVPQAVADGMPDAFTPQIDVLNNDETKERYDILVEAIPMYNLREEALGFHQKGRGNGYVLNIDGIRIYISGDTEDIPEMRALEDIDIAFICMNLPYTMTEESAADAVLEFGPKQVYPYHYRGRPDVSDVKKFKEIIYTGNPQIEVVLMDWYPDAAY